jgi:hypothetical protein
MTDQLAARNVMRPLGGNVDSDFFEPFAASMENVRNVAQRMMVGAYKRNIPEPIREWQETTPLIGAASLARLLGHVGHPRVAIPHWWDGTGSARVLVAGEPYLRSVSQLWAYCGHGDPTRKIRRGMTAAEVAAMGNPSAKSIVWNMATCVVKGRRFGGPYVDVYDAARESAEQKCHSVECARCGPSGRPAPVGSPWSKAHQHAHALRLVGKAILRDLWVAAG